MKINRTILSIWIYCITVAVFAGNTMPIADRLLCDTSFVLKGEMDAVWQKRNLRFAVTDPVRNHCHKIETDRTGRIMMRVPMRGMMQEIYLYIDRSVTIPVCAGDTIVLSIGRDDMSLSAPEESANLDMQLAYALHRKTIRNDADISSAYNQFHKLTQGNTIRSQKSDSLLTLICIKINGYIDRCQNVVDTFIEHHGSPRSEAYFRISGYFRGIRFIAASPELNYLSKTVKFPPSSTPLSYNCYDDSLLVYPAYRNFMITYVCNVAYRANNMFHLPRDATSLYKTIRAIAPTETFADWLNLNVLARDLRLSPANVDDSSVKYVYETTKTSVIKDEVFSLANDIARLARGENAPPIALKDTDGRMFGNEDFKGKFLYLDFWDFGCLPCMREFAMMQQLKKLYPDINDRVSFVTVCGSKPSKRKLEEFARKHEMTDLNLIFDAKRSDRCYNTGIYPTYILIDPAGRIVEFNTDRPSYIVRDKLNGRIPLLEQVVYDRRSEQ